jgi:hypothetical protein
MENKLTLQAGLLVSLSSSVTGGVVYARRDLDERCGKAGRDAMGAPAVCKLLGKQHDGDCDFSELTAEEVTRWETTRTIADKAEHDKAVKVRNKARSLITAVCCSSNFGNLCLASKEKELDDRFAEAKQMVDEYNRQAQFTRVSIYMLKGVIPDTSNSARSISSEIIELIDQMLTGISAGDEDAVREAANKLTQLSEMLGDAARAMVEKSIAEARSAARAIVKAKEEREAGAASGGLAQQTSASIAKQKEADRTATAKRTLQQARTALDMNSDVLASIEAAASKRAG